MISIQNLTVRLGGREIIRDLSWNISTGTRAAVVGDNGAGKSTLLKAVMGLVPAENGCISMPAGRNIGYLPQELTDQVVDMDVMTFLKDRTGLIEVEKEIESLHLKMEKAGNESDPAPAIATRYERAHSRYEQLEGYSFEGRAKKVLKGLGFDDDDYRRNCREFSGGWKMRLILASLLLSFPDILLLDEPTNHLDSESMEWLENWLLGFGGTMLVIAHDRRFLDKMVNETGELGPGGLTVYKGNYSSYLQKREELIEQRERDIRKQQKEVDRELQFIERFRSKASKASQVQSRIKKLEKLDRLREINIEESEVDIRFPQSPRSGHEVLKVEDLSKEYSGKVVLNNISFSLYRGEKAALVGINGAGKSTLSRLIGGTEIPSSGTISFGHNVKCAFFSQESSGNLNYDNTIWEEVFRCGNLDAQHKRNLLGAFLFRGDDIHKKTGVLSGGEKSRLALLKILLQESNFLVLDEATNHLDMRTKDVFLRALLQYEGTVLTVSHDRHFLDQLVERVIEIRDGKIRNYPGDYSYFIEKRKQLLDLEEGKTPAKSTSPVTDQQSRKREEAEKRNQIYRAKKKILEKVNPIEERIAQLESSMENADTLLCDPQTLADSGMTSRIMIQRSRDEEELSHLMEKWETLMQEVEDIEAGG